MAQKIVCDVCGQDADPQEFVMPCVNSYYAVKNGVKIHSFNRIDTCLLNLCSAHRRQIAHYMRELREQHNKV